MQYRDVRLWLVKAGELIAILGIKRAEVEAVRVPGLSCLVPAITVTPECFLRLYRVNNCVAIVNREGDFLHGEFRIRGFAISCSVWCKGQDINNAKHWESLNQLSRPALEIKRPAIGVKRSAIADQRRLIGLPAPKVVDVH